MKAAALSLCLLSTVASANVTHTFCMTSAWQNYRLNFTLRCEFGHAYYDSRYTQWMKMYCTPDPRIVPFGNEKYWFVHLMPPPPSDIFNHHYTFYFAIPCDRDITHWSYLETLSRDNVLRRDVIQNNWYAEDQWGASGCTAP